MPQMTPSPSKVSRDMKENLQGSLRGAPSAMLASQQHSVSVRGSSDNQKMSSGMSGPPSAVGAKMACAPQKFQHGGSPRPITEEQPITPESHLERQRDAQIEERQAAQPRITSEFLDAVPECNEQVLDNMGSGLAPELRGNNRGNAVNHCYPSFYNQPNFVGDPSVKPFCINTPAQSQIGANKFYNANQAGSTPV